MANFRYFHPSDNVAPNATVTTGSTANTSYPLTNLTDFTYKNLPNPSKLIGMTGDWILDFASAQRIDAVVLWHNFDSALPYRVQMNATNSWTSPTVNLLTAAPTKRTDGRTLKSYHDLTGVSGYSASGFRYLRINVIGTGSPAVGNSAALGLKLLVFSTIRTTVKNIRWGWRRDETQTGIRMTTDARFPWAYDIQSSGRLLEFAIPARDADFAAISAWVQASAGFVKPTVMIPDPSVNDALLGFLANGAQGTGAGLQMFRLEAPYEFTNLNPLRLEFEELTAGDPEWV